MTASRSEARTELAGWGNTGPTPANLVTPTDVGELATVLGRAGRRGIVARGLGRSYGDPAQNAGGTVVDTTGVVEIGDLDPEAGTVHVAAGTSLDALIRWLVPRGWFVPVTPGTRQVTVGGAIASDVHGKNHHQAGSFCASVRAIDIVTPAGGRRTIGPTVEPDLFWATAGGMGLTGVIVAATIEVKSIETSLLRVDTDRTPDLDTTIELMESGDHAYDYSVAWVDLMTTGGAMGRSVLDRANFARLPDLPAAKRGDPLAYTAPWTATFPTVPTNLIRWGTTKVFNEAWFRKAPRRRRGHLTSIPGFFHPLDRVDRWNRIYGSAGVLQWQCALPVGATGDLRWIVEQLAETQRPSFLAVLKRFGPANPGPLSFPVAGWTLALDTPVRATDTLGPLLDRLDERVVEAGGRIYLAKDGRMRPELLGAMYPRLHEWQAVRDAADPEHVMASDLARRLGLVDRS